MTINAELLAAIQGRSSKKTLFNHGILTADRYVKTLLDRIGSDACYKFASKGRTSFQDVLEKAASTLVYGNEDMVVEEIEWQKAKAGQPKELDGIELPKNTLMVFKHVLTTPRKDRDGDILRTDGAVVDPKLPLLWQHVHTLPIGKMLTIANRNEKKLTLISAIVDLNEVAHDAAVMIDSGMGRFSHGFRALEFTKIKGEREGDNEQPDQGSFDVKKFEIMEQSLVSVPSNVDAEVEEVILGLVEGGKLKSGLMKQFGKEIREQRPVTVGVKFKEQIGDYTREIEGNTAKDIGDVILAVKETEDENLTGDGSGKTKAGGEKPTGTPKETDDDCNEGGGTKEPTDPEGLTGDKGIRGDGTLEGSYESVRSSLSRKCKEYLQSKGVEIPKEGYMRIEGTFDDRVIVGVDDYKKNLTKFYEVPWKMGTGGKEPEFEGDPKEVEIEISTTIRDKMKAAKAGRVLSKKTLGQLESTTADIDRGAKRLKELVDSVKTKPEAEAAPDELTVKEVAGRFLAFATKEDRQQMQTAIAAMNEADKRAEQTKELRALVGSIQ